MSIDKHIPIQNVTQIVKGEMFAGYMAYLCQINIPHVKPRLIFTYWMQTSRAHEDIVSSKWIIQNALKNADQWHEDLPIFPNVHDIIMNHTAFTAYMPFTTYGGQAYSFIHRHQVLRSPYPVWNDATQALVYCPECVAQDIKTYGRPIFYVIHQLKHMYFCPKHHCTLRTISFIDSYSSASFLDKSKPITERKMTEYDEKIGLLYQSQLDMQLFVSKEMTGEVLFNAVHQSNIGREIEKMPADLSIPQNRVKNISKSLKMSCFEAVPLAAAICPSMNEYRDQERFDSTARIKIHLPDAMKNNSLVTLTDFGPLMKFKCLKCGTIFYAHPVDILLGRICPGCAGSLPNTELFSRYTEGTSLKVTDVQDNRISYTSESGAASNTIFYDFYSIINKRKIRGLLSETGTSSSHVGERRLNNWGRACTIIEMTGHDKIKVRFDDGIIIESTFGVFIKGLIRHPEDKNIHIGEKYTLSDGSTAAVIGVHRSKQKLKYTVQMEDGSTFVALHYQIRKEAEAKLRKKQRNHIGEKFILSDGSFAEIVQQLKRNTVIVRLRTGIEIKTAYQKIKQNAEKALNINYIGETLTLSNGSIVTIVDQKEDKTVTCRMDDGETFTAIRNGVKRKAENRLKKRLRDMMNNHIGEKFTLPDGMTAEIVDQRGTGTVTVRMPDGHTFTSAYRKASSKAVKIVIQKLREERKLYIGGKYSLSNGTVAEVIDQIDENHVIVRMEDGTVFHTEHSYAVEKAESIIRKRSHIGETYKLSNGTTAEIVDQVDVRRVIVQLEDGTIFHTEHSMVMKKAESIIKRSHIGEKFVLSDGTTVEIIGKVGLKYVTARMQNGTIFQTSYRFVRNRAEKILKEGNKKTAGWNRQ